MALKQDGVQFVLFPEQSNIIEGFVLNMARVSNPQELNYVQILVEYCSPLSLLSLQPSIIDAFANSRAGMEVLDDPEVGPDKGRSTFQPLIRSKERDLIRTLAKRSCPLDPLPTSLVFSCLDILLPVTLSRA